MSAAASCPRCTSPNPSAKRWCLRCGLALVGPVPPPATSLLAGSQAAALPIVQPHDWPGRERTACRSLCFLPRLAGTPWLALHYEVGDLMAYVGEERLQKLGQRFVDVERGAIANLCATPASWQPLQLPTRTSTMRALGCIDDPKACERILDRPFLMHAHTMFSSRHLAAAIPQRGMLLVTDFENFEHLMKIAEAHHAAAENQPITPWVFTLQDGLVTGRCFEEDGQLGVDAVVLPPEYES